MLDYLTFPYVSEEGKILAVIDFERFPNKSDVDAWASEIFNDCSDVAQEISQVDNTKILCAFLESITIQIREQIVNNTGFLAEYREELLDNLDKHIDDLKHPKQSALSRLLSSFRR